MLVDNDNIDSLEIGKICRFEWICIGQIVMLMLLTVCNSL